MKAMRNFAKSEPMWEVYEDGSIVNTETHVRFVHRRGLWKVDSASVTMARIAGIKFERRKLYVLELECNLWAHERRFIALKHVA